MPEVYEKYFEYYTLQWRVKDKKSCYSKGWHGLNPDICPAFVYRAFCAGRECHDMYCFIGEKTAIKCFHIVQKDWRNDPDHKNFILRLIYVKKRVKMETEQVVQS